MDLTVGSGDVSLRDLSLGTPEADAEVGNVTLSGRFSRSGSVSVGTGDIVSRLPSGDASELSLKTRVGEVSRERPGNRERQHRAGG